MYTTDLLTALERALGWEPASTQSVAERENAILAEIKRLRQPKAPRLKAADAATLASVTRTVTMELLAGLPAYETAKKHGISADQARRVAANEIQAAARVILGRIKSGQTANMEWALATLQWVSETDRSRILTRARDNRGVVETALKAYWIVLDNSQ